MIRLMLLAAILTPMLKAQQTLSTLVDRNRVLLVFAPASTDGRFGQQLTAFNHHEADLRSRDVVVVPLLRQPGPPVTSNTLRTLQPPLIQDDEQLIIRRRFHIADIDFVVILLGKDGGEKLRSTRPLTIERLNKTIDAMPMRKDEMRQQP